MMQWALVKAHAVQFYIKFAVKWSFPEQASRRHGKLNSSCLMRNWVEDWEYIDHFQHSGHITALDHSYNYINKGII